MKVYFISHRVPYLGGHPVGYFTNVWIIFAGHFYKWLSVGYLIFTASIEDIIPDLGLDMIVLCKINVSYCNHYGQVDLPFYYLY